MPAPAPLPTIICPNCKQTLPFRAQICQFCKSDVRTVQRAALPETKTVTQAGTDWKVVMYYVMGVWWVLNGLVVTLASAKILSQLLAGPGAFFSGIPAIGMIIGVIFTFTGVGLLLKVELARGIVNILSWLSIASALMTGAGLLFAGIIMGPKNIIPLMKALFDLIVAAFQIYLIAETDKFM